MSYVATRKLFVPLLVMQLLTSDTYTTSETLSPAGSWKVLELEAGLGVIDEITVF